MNNTLVLNFLEQINKLNKKILVELKNQDNINKLIEEEASLISALDLYIKESSKSEELDKSGRSEELLVTMTELSKLVENVIKTVPNLKEDDDKVLNNLLTFSAINIVSKVLEVSEKKK